jgi:uncharacterized protein
MGSIVSKLLSMKPARDLDPRHLDMAAFCAQHASLDGHWSVAAFERLLDGSVPDAQAPEVAWQAQGDSNKRAGSAAEHRLHLRVQATVWRQCQRCLGPLALPLAVDRIFRFETSEETAAKLDEESEEEDVLVLSRNFDLHELVEDELPIVPMHDVCPVELKMSVDTEGDEVVDDKPNPFAALAALKKKH